MKKFHNQSLFSSNLFLKRLFIILNIDVRSWNRPMKYEYPVSDGLVLFWTMLCIPTLRFWLIILKTYVFRNLDSEVTGFMSRIRVKTRSSASFLYFSYTFLCFISNLSISHTAVLKGHDIWGDKRDQPSLYWHQNVAFEINMVNWMWTFYML